MSINRRKFIKIAGMSTLLGIGGLSAVDKFRGKSPEALADVQSDIAGVFQTPEAITAKRWAMVVDMRKFDNPEIYKKCIDACHSIHNVPDMPRKKDEIKWIWTDTYEHTFPTMENEFIPEEIKEKPFLLLCNHCDNPPCVRVCPTKATFRRESDGIVMMDQHRCIGCRFCMAACPFGARSFNYTDPNPYIAKKDPTYPARTIGVVEKCTFCAERLVKGLMPACVEASDGALIFGDLDDPDSKVRKILVTHFNIRRKPELGTRPSVYYLIGGIDNA